MEAACDDSNSVQATMKGVGVSNLLSSKSLVRYVHVVTLVKTVTHPNTFVDEFEDYVK